jgi:hypothetical protein
MQSLCCCPPESLTAGFFNSSFTVLLARIKILNPVQTTDCFDTFDQQVEGIRNTLFFSILAPIK